MKSIAVIGPDAAQLQAVASRLVRCRALPGGGPDDRPDGIIAVAGDYTPENEEVVVAVAVAMGAVVLYSPAPWPQIPGVHQCPVRTALTDPQDIAELQSWVDELWVDKQEWLLDARRADAERSERVRLWLRLQAQRTATEVLEAASEHPVRDIVAYAGSCHREFVARLHVALLRQGVEAPFVDDAVPTLPPAPGRRSGPLGMVLFALAGTIGLVAVGFGVGRGVGHPAWGLACGALAALALAGVRWRMAQRGVEAVDRERVHRVLREHWGGIAAEVASKVRTPRVAEALTAPPGVP